MLAEALAQSTALVGDAATEHCGEADPAAIAVWGRAAIPAVAMVPAIISRRLQWVRDIVQIPSVVPRRLFSLAGDIGEEVNCR